MERKPHAVSGILLILALLAVTPGCFMRQDAVRSPAGISEDRPVGEVDRTEEPDPAIPPPAAADEMTTKPQVEPEAETVATELPLQIFESGVDEPYFEEDPITAGVGEDPVTESPLDELAEEIPELTPEEVEEKLDQVAIQKAPTFDIPIEINDKVLAWIDRYSVNHKTFTEGSLARSGRYMEMFRRIFAEEGLPQDLVYMAHVESGYKTSAYSRARARGIFQFMAATGRRYGLRVDYWVDERADPEKSARAAAKYMKKLYGDFGDWYLAIAAYNAGEGKIRRGLARSGKKDFWGLAKTRYIRRETKNHVPAIIAATLLSKEPEKYGLTFESEAPIDYENIVVKGAADLRVLARCAGTDYDTMKQLNPALRRNQTPAKGSTDVRVPAGAAGTTLAALEKIPREDRVLFARHRVRRGETLSVIAQRHRTSVRAIQAANGMGRRTMIRVDQVLRIPSNASANYPAADATGATGEVLTYRVRRGDNLYAISRRYRTSPGAIAAASGISIHKTLQIGERLKIVPGVRRSADARRIARGGGRVASKKRPAAKTEGSSLVHVIRRGDTLWDIASLYRTTVNTLCSLNKITPRTVLYPGNKLTVGSK